MNLSHPTTPMRPWAALRPAAIALLLSVFVLGLSKQAHSAEEPPAALTKAPLHGVVLDASNAPAPGAELLLVHRHSIYSRDYRDAIVEKITADAQGKFRFTKPLRFATLHGSLEADLFLLLVKHSTGAAWKMIAGVDPENVEPTLKLEASRSVDVRVQRANGSPVSNATVWISIASTRKTREEARVVRPVGWIEATTNADGLATLYGVPDSAWEVSATAEGYFNAPSPARASFPRAGEKPSASPVSLILEDAAIFEGTVVDHENQPIPGLPIFIKNAQGGDQDSTRFVTDAQGRFRVDGLIPTSTRKTWDWAVWATGDEWTSAPLTLSLSPGEHRADIRIQATRGIVMRGLARDPATLKPIAGARVSVAPDHPGRTQLGMHFNYGWTDAEGRFAVRVAPGSFAVALAGLPTGYCMTGEGAVGTHYFVYDTRVPREILLEAPAPLKRFVTVQGRTEPPIEGASVQATAVNDMKISGTSRVGPINGAAFGIYTDANGIFEAKEWPENTDLTIFISSAKAKRAGLTRLKTGQGPEIAATVEMQETFPVRVLVKDAQGNPLANRSIDIRPTLNEEWIGSLPDAKTDKDGIAKVARILPGLTYEVRDSENIRLRDYVILLKNKPAAGEVPLVEVSLSQ